MVYDNVNRCVIDCSEYFSRDDNGCCDVNLNRSLSQFPPTLAVVDGGGEEGKIHEKEDEGNPWRANDQDQGVFED